MSKPVVLTGLRANNNLTIGNYFGGMLPIIDMAKQRSEEYQINMFIPDLHSFTTPIDHSQLNDQVLLTAKLFAAAGLPLDNDGIHLYRQSYISAHSELTWILDCFTGFGEMSRMTQFKDKSRSLYKENSNTFNNELAGEAFDHDEMKRRQDEVFEKIVANVSVGLFNYPVLMAADILLYNAEFVPVGDDQSQHLEFTRDIGERLNKRFGEIFTLPKAVREQHEFFGKEQGLRIKDLVDPSKKMSKSDESGRGVIFLNDSPEDAAKKIMGATTDDKAEIHFDRENQPGISNLLEILTLLRGSSLDEVISEFEGQTRYGDFKGIVAEEVKQFLANFQMSLSNVKDEEVIAKLESSEQTLTVTANETLLRVQQAVGLRPKA
ncbi:MAG: tryptophanyl-tRNA synthetase, tryptophanyl-tRNA synthetase [Candidatus Saccharibacteria bacterium]|nr:tryptophanyl-tRNA synthetase, tryptophanyl-tRNA synthetase [Candidatus Saccharibacteria bacterium]